MGGMYTLNKLDKVEEEGHNLSSFIQFNSFDPTRQLLVPSIELLSLLAIPHSSFYSSALPSSRLWIQRRHR